MKDPDHLIATLDAALKDYMAGFDTAVKFVSIDQVDMLAEFYLNRRRADLSPQAVRVKGLEKSQICEECDGDGKRHFMRQTPRGPVDDADECRACEGYGIVAAPAPDIGALVEALQFYANPANWRDTPPWDGDPDCISPKAIPGKSQDDVWFCDCGDTARAALAALKGGAS